MRGNVLVIDDEHDVFEELEECLVAHNLFHAPTLTGVRDVMSRRTMDLAIVDLNLKVEGNDRFSGLQYIRKLRKRYPNMSILVISKYDDPERITEAIQNGADSYIWKGGFNPYTQEFREQINQLVKSTKKREDLSLEYKREIWGKSPQTRMIAQRLELYAKENTSFILQGEQGVGKENYVQYLHYLAANTYHHYAIEREPVIVDAKVLSKKDLQSIFKFDSGRKRKTFLDRANNNILYLNNLDQFPLSRQRDLLYILQTGKYPKSRQALNIQFVGGMESSPEEGLETGKILPELFHSISTISIDPLRKRKADIQALIQSWLREKDINPELLNDEQFKIWLRYDYPRNTSELFDLLRETVETHQARYPSGEKWKRTPFDFESLPDVILNSRDADSDMFFEAARLELSFIENALQRFDGRRDQKSRAAELVGISSADNMTKTYIKKYWRLYPELVSQHPMIMQCYGLTHKGKTS